MGLAGLLIIFCVLQLFNPSLRRVEDQAALEADAARRAAGRAKREV